MPLDHTQIQEKIEAVHKELDAYELKRRMIRNALNLLNDIQFRVDRIETKPAIGPITENGVIVTPAQPAEYEDKYYMPMDASLPTQKLKAARQQEIFDECIEQLKKVSVNV